jgi:hypothetical protein
MASSANPAGEDLPSHKIKKPQGSVRRFMRIAGGYWKGDQKWSAWALTSGLIVLGIAQILLQIWINLWNKNFFDAVEHKNWPAFFHQMTIFAAIVVISMAAMASHLTVKRRLQYSLCRWLRPGLSTAGSGRPTLPLGKFRATMTIPMPVSAKTCGFRLNRRGVRAKHLLLRALLCSFMSIM